MEEFLGEFSTYAMIGLVNGLVYAVVALGFTLILGVMQVINFTHGVLFAFGAYFSFTIQRYFQLPFWVGLVVSPILVGVLGIILERIAIRKTYGGNPLFGLLLTFGMATALEAVIRMVPIWGKVGYSVKAPEFIAGSIELGFMTYSKYRLFLAALAILIIFATWLFLEKTPYGGIIKAGAYDSEMIMALGKNLPRLRMYVFGLGAVLAGIAGVIAAPIYSVKPAMGTDILMPAFIIVVLGGIGSFWGSVIGGLIVGMSKSMIVMVFPRAEDIIPYVIMALILMFRQRGLMGEKSVLEA